MELGDAVKPDLRCRLMTGHDSIGQRRHSRVSTLASERSRTEDVHEHTDSHSAVERAATVFPWYIVRWKQGKKMYLTYTGAMSIRDTMSVK